MPLLRFYLVSSIPEAEYTQAICDEITSIAASLESRPLVSIFFGGGTQLIFRKSHWESLAMLNVN